ncbi:carotenoid-cleaving dioxygenase, mitochondrial-like [Rhipicephalus microplus]|uniref:carotenoid-cleaving dioxygenase, mitochondrial-like n=1 Tax=Rhipicephalus microplus TaxID=6941 RepID=UPI003F6D52B1
MWKVDQDSLEAVQRYDVNKLVSVNLASAHPVTREDGTSYNLGASFVSGLKYHIIKMPPPGKGLFGSEAGLGGLPHTVKLEDDVQLLLQFRHDAQLRGVCRAAAIGQRHALDRIAHQGLLLQGLL